MFDLDALILNFDRGLRTVAGRATARRPNPAETVAEPALESAARAESAALMRVNHCGEVCAQALYQGQAAATHNPQLKEALVGAAHEEEDHLAWCEGRIEELGGRTSVLNPVWYAGSFLLGFAAGKLGDGWNLAFLEETEKQVERHLQGHLDRLDPQDHKTRAIVATMQEEEARHARTAHSLGAKTMPAWVQRGMALSAKVMTTLSYRI